MHISIFSIELKKIGVEDVTLSLKTGGSLIYFLSITTLVTVNVWKSNVKDEVVRIKQETQSRQQSTEESTDFH